MAEDTTRTRALKEHRGRAWIAWLAGVLAVLTSIWQISTRVAAPYLVGVVQEAVAADTERKIEAKLAPAVAPLKETLKGMLESKVAELEDQVQLESFRRSQAPTKWQEIDELRLSQMRRRLAQEQAKLQELSR